MDPDLKVGLYGKRVLTVGVIASVKVNCYTIYEAFDMVLRQ